MFPRFFQTSSKTRPKDFEIPSITSKTTTISGPRDSLKLYFKSKTQVVLEFPLNYFKNTTQTIPGILSITSTHRRISGTILSVTSKARPTRGPSDFFKLLQKQDTSCSQVSFKLLQEQNTNCLRDSFKLLQKPSTNGLRNSFNLLQKQNTRIP